MASEYSYSEDYDEEEERQAKPAYALFKHDYYLSSSLDEVSQWSDNYKGTSTLECLEREYKDSVSRPELLIKTIGQIRYIQFIGVLRTAFEECLEHYKKCYSRWGQSQKELREIIPTEQQLLTLKKLNETLVTKLLSYLRFIEITFYLVQCDSFEEEVKQNDKIAYDCIIKMLPMITDPYTIWKVMEIIQDFKDVHFNRVFIANMAASSDDLHSALENFISKHFQIKQLISQATIRNQVYDNILIARALKLNLEQKVITELALILRGITFKEAKKQEQSLKMKLIFTDMNLIYQRTNNMNLNQLKAQMQAEQQEKLQIQALQQSFYQPDILEVMLYYAEPTLTAKKSKKRATHNKDGPVEKQQPKEKEKGLEQLLFEQLQMMMTTFREQFPVPGSNPYLFQPQNFALVVNYLTNFQQQSKEIFYREDQGDTAIYQRYIQMLKSLKDLYLSFAEDVWIAPFAISAILSLKFFDKMSQDLKADVKQILYKMVGNLNNDKLPKKAVLKRRQGSMSNKGTDKSRRIQTLMNDWQVVLEPISRLQYLEAIMFYLDEVSQGGQFVNLPEIIPENIETAILFITSLKLRLQHHKPTAEQEPYYCLLMEQCSNFKLTNPFSWYKAPKGPQDRQMEFNIEKELPEANKKIFRKALNIRDLQTLNTELENKTPTSQIVDLLKYNRGINVLSAPINISEEELFNLLDIMRTFLSMNFDVFNMSIEQQVHINYVHISLAFYSTKIKQAEGSEIYEQILQKVLIPWLENTNNPKKAKQIKQTYFLFFEPWVYKFLFIEIGHKIGGLLCSSQRSKECEQDLLPKLKFYRNLLENVDLVATSQDLISQLLLVLISSLSNEVPLKCTIQTCQILSELLIKVPSLKELFSMSAVLNEELVGQRQFLDLILQQNYPVSRFLLRHLVGQLNQFVENKTITANSTLGLLEAYKKACQGKADLKPDEDINQFMSKLNCDSASPFVIMLKAMNSLGQRYERRDVYFNMFDEEKTNALKEESNANQEWFKFGKLLKSKNEEELKELKAVKFSKLTFMDKILDQISLEEQSLPQKIFEEMILQLASSEDLIYFADKLNNLELLNRDQKTFDILLLENYHFTPEKEKKKQKTSHSNLIRKILKLQDPKKVAYYKKLKVHAENLVKTLQQNANKRKVENYHLIRLIAINQKYPSPIVQKFILSNLQLDRKTNLKIYQSYLITNIKQKLCKLPDDLSQKVIFHGQNHQRIIADIFEKLLLVPSEHFNIYLTSQHMKKSQTKKQEAKISEKNQQVQADGEWETESENNGSQIDNEQDWESEGDSQEKQSPEKKQQKTTAKKKEQQQLSVVERQFAEDMKMEEEQYPNRESVEIELADQQGDELGADESSSVSLNHEQYYDYERPDFIDKFVEDPKLLQVYKNYIILRQQIDIHVKCNYGDNYHNPKLGVDEDSYINEKSNQIVKELNSLDEQFAKTIVSKIPPTIFKVLKLNQRGLNVIPEHQQRKRAPFKNVKFVDYFFSERQQSDDSGADDNEDDYDGDSELGRFFDEEDYYENGHFFQLELNSDGELIIQEMHRPEGQMVEKNQSQEEKSVEAETQELISPPPAMKTQNISKESVPPSKVFKTTFTSEEMVKILQIALIQLITLQGQTTEYEHVTEFYRQLIQSKLGRIFTQSLLTVLRIDENIDKYNQFIEILAKQKPNIFVPTLKRALLNATYVLEESIQEAKVNSKLNKRYKSFLLPSQTLLPIADRILTKFDLPIQDNRLTLLLIYIRCKDLTIKNSIQALPLNAEQLDGKLQKKEKFLSKKKDLQRVIKEMYTQNCSATTWDFVKEKFGFKPKGLTNLIMCQEIYSKQIHSQMATLMRKIHALQTNLKSNNILAEESDISALKSLKRKSTDDQNYYQFLSPKLTLQSQFHIYSTLINSYKVSAKQFHFISKYNLKAQILNQQSGEEDFSKLRKQKDSVKQEILNNPKIIRTLEMMYYLLDFMRNKFHGKVEEKRFNKLISVPKHLIETSLMILYSFLDVERWKKDSATAVPLKDFFKKHEFGTYKFKSIQEISQLFFNFLNLEVFCSNRFKHMIVPYLIKHPEAGIHVPLIFKAPGIPEDIDGQRIFLTRECSFDMAFYQLKFDSFLVEYHQQEGSDHGGMVREFMMGWRGQGVGEQAFFIGKLLGISFKQGIPYGGHFDFPMALAITQSKPNMELLQEVDPRLYTNLKYIEQNDPKDLGLGFLGTKQIHGKVYNFELIPQGGKFDVTQANKMQYIQRYLQTYWVWGRTFQLEQLKEGFYSIVPEAYVKIFTPQELMKKIKGEEVIDRKKLKERTKYEEGYSETSTIIIWLWEIIEAFNQEEMNKFMQFVTGSPKVSIFDSNFELTVQKVFDTNRLPVAHTCFNTLDLPQYSTKELLQKYIMLAIFDGNDNFGIL